MKKRLDLYPWGNDEYPTVLTKDQRHKLCQNSKRTASYEKLPNFSSTWHRSRLT